MGHAVIETPNLDQLARTSATFTHGYVPTALCRPSLATMITGLYPYQHRITGNDPAIPSGIKNPRGNADYLAVCQQLISNIERVDTIPRLLKNAGYVSFQSGKWWEGNFRRGGFTAGMTHGDPQRGGRHGDDGLKIGREGMQPIFDFIDQNETHPFFLWYAPFLPHAPHNPPPRLIQKYTAAGRPPELVKYYAMCEWFDESCGQLLSYLDKKNLSDRTLVIYVTDNGWIQRTGDTPLPPNWNQAFAPKSKQSPYDGGVRTPIMIRWPGKVKPGMYPQLVSSLDLMPTILDALHIETSEALPGVSLLPACNGQALSRDAIFGESYAHDIADINDPSASLLYRWCIEGNWKLIVSYPGKIGRYQAVQAAIPKEMQLFDLEADPFETKNLAGNRPELVERLKTRINKEFER
jgi:uncharacterized sulfatase